MKSLEACTFHPNLPKSQNGSVSPTNVAERNLAWLEHKEKSKWGLNAYTDHVVEINKIAEELKK